MKTGYPSQPVSSEIDVLFVFGLLPKCSSQKSGCWVGQECMEKLPKAPGSTIGLPEAGAALTERD